MEVTALRLDGQWCGNYYCMYYVSSFVFIFAISFSQSRDCCYNLHRSVPSWQGTITTAPFTHEDSGGTALP